MLAALEQLFYRQHSFTIPLPLPCSTTSPFRENSPNDFGATQFSSEKKTTPEKTQACSVLLTQTIKLFNNHTFNNSAVTLVAYFNQQCKPFKTLYKCELYTYFGVFNKPQKSHSSKISILKLINFGNRILI